MEAHATSELLKDPARHLQRLCKQQPESLVATCIVALARQQEAAQRCHLSGALVAAAERLLSEAATACVFATELHLLVSALRHGDHARQFCRSVIASVDLAMCGFDDPGAVRARFDDDDLWKFLPAPGVELPTAAWWAQWCSGDMRQCRPIGRSMPAHAVLASLLQLSNAANPRAELFAERVSALFALRSQQPVDPTTSDEDRYGGGTVLELFIADTDQVLPSEAKRLALTSRDDVEHLASVARSVAIVAVQQAGGRYLHLGIARPRRLQQADFETIKDRFLKMGALADDRHSALDLGVAAPVTAVKVPSLASIVKHRECGGVPLTFRRYDFDVARATADQWLKGMPGNASLPLCATFASMGQGKTVQLLLSLGLLVEAFGGAGLYATGNNDQDYILQSIFNTHGVRDESMSPELAMAMAVFHRACTAQVSTESASRLDSNDPVVTSASTHTAEAAFKQQLESMDMSDPAQEKVSRLLGKKLFLTRKTTLRTAFKVARALLGCRDRSVPLFLAVDEVARFASDFRGDREPAPEETLRMIASAAEKCGAMVVPMAGALACFDLAKLATAGSARPLYLMPLSPLLPMDQRLAELLPPIAKAICCRRAEFRNPPDEVRRALSRVGVLLMSTGGHARTLAAVLGPLGWVTEQHVADLINNPNDAQTAMEILDEACSRAERAVSCSQQTFEQYESAELKHPCLSVNETELIVKPEEAYRVLRHLVVPFMLPKLHDKAVTVDENTVLRKYMSGSWEFAAAGKRRHVFKVHPPPIALPAVLSRFLVDATSAPGVDSKLLKDRLEGLFVLVLEMNHIVMAFAVDSAVVSDEDTKYPQRVEHPHFKLFELVVGRAIALLLMLPVQVKGSIWLAEHMHLCRGACTMDALRGAALPSSQPPFSIEELRALSGDPAPERFKRAVAEAEGLPWAEPPLSSRPLISDKIRNQVEFGVKAAKLLKATTLCASERVLHGLPLEDQQAVVDMARAQGKVAHAPPSCASSKAPERLPQHRVSFPVDMRNTKLALLPPEDLKAFAADVREHVLPRATPGVNAVPAGVLHLTPTALDNALCDFVHVVARPDGGLVVLLWEARAHYHADGCLLDVIGFETAADADAARAADGKATALRRARTDFDKARRTTITVNWCRRAGVITSEERHLSQHELKQRAVRRLSRRAAYLQLPDLQARLQHELSVDVRVIVAVVSLGTCFKEGEHKVMLPSDCRALTVEELSVLCPALGLPLRAAST